MLLTFYRFINNSGVNFTMIVDIKKLSVDYSGVKALDDISFGIAKVTFWESLDRTAQENLRCLDACLDCTHSMMEQSSSLDRIYGTLENIYHMWDSYHKSQ